MSEEAGQGKWTPKTNAGKAIVTVGAVAAALSTMIVFSGQVDDLLPDYATAMELQEFVEDVEKMQAVLVGGQKANSVEIIAIQQRATQAAIYRNQAEIDRADRRGSDDPNYATPQYLIEERILLENNADRLRREMTRLTK